MTTLRHFADIYRHKLTALPEMTGVEYAREHGWISDEECQQQQEQSTQGLAELQRTMIQMREAAIREGYRDRLMRELHELVSQIHLFREEYLHYVQRIGENKPAFDYSFSYTLSDDILALSQTIIEGRDERYALGRVGWIGYDIIQHLPSLQSDTTS